MPVVNVDVIDVTAIVAKGVFGTTPSKVPEIEVDTAWLSDTRLIPGICETLSEILFSTSEKTDNACRIRVASVVWGAAIEAVATTEPGASVTPTVDAETTACLATLS